MSDETGDVDQEVVRLMNACRRIAEGDIGRQTIRELREALDDMDDIMESQEPIANGWLDKRGQP